MIFNRRQRDQRMDPEDIREIEELRIQAFLGEDVKEGRQSHREKMKPVLKGY